MKNSIRAALALLLITSVSLIFTACSSLPSDAAATVNGVVITKDDVEARIRVGAGINPTTTPADPESEAYKNYQRDMTAQMVSEEVEKQEGTRRGITVSEDEIDGIVQQIVEDKYLGSVQKMEEDFSRRGITSEDLRSDILRRLLHQKILQSLRDEVAPSDDEVLAQYEADKSNYVYPEKRQVRQLVVADEAAAQALANQVAAGGDMAVIAGQNSIDGKTKTDGGMVGVVTRDQLSKTVGDVAFSLPARQVSEPFKGDLGWYVLRVELITPATNQTFEQVKDQLKLHLSNQRLTERYKTYVEDIKGDYDIEYADGYEPREATPTVGPPETTVPQ